MIYLRLLIIYLFFKKKVLKISEQVHSSVEGKLTKKQREFYLRQQVIWFSPNIEIFPNQTNIVL